jgi:hypothetical protein
VGTGFRFGFDIENSAPTHNHRTKPHEKILFGNSECLLALATTSQGGGKHQGLSDMYAAKMKGYTNSTAVRWTETSSLRLSPMEGVTHSPFSVLHSKIGITTIFDGCSIPYDAKPRPHEEGARAWRNELMRGRTSSRQSSCREEGARTKKELVEELVRGRRSSWKSSRERRLPTMDDSSGVG